MRINEFNESQQLCPECGGPSFSNLLLAEKQDACYAKVKSRYKVWPSAYASGALVQCRKKGAANWGNKSKNEGVAEGSNPIHPELHKKLTAGGYTHVKDNEYTHPTHGKVKVKPSGTDSYSRTRNGLKPEGVRVHGKGIDSYKSNWTNKSSKFEEDVAKTGFTKTPSGDYINQHTGVRSSKPPVKKKRGEKTGAEWDAIEKAKKDKQQGVAEGYNAEYDDEAGMAQGSLHTLKNAVEGLQQVIDSGDNLPEWCQEKISLAEDYLVTVWDYLQSEKAQGVDPELNEEFDLIESIVDRIAAQNGVESDVVWTDLESLTEDELYAFAVTSQLNEDWQKANKSDRTDGMSRKAVKAYRRAHPGSKLQTAVTTKPSKLKRGSKASKRRKSYCSRSKGQMNMHNISCAKTPDKAICKARRRWNC